MLDKESVKYSVVEPVDEGEAADKERVEKEGLKRRVKQTVERRKELGKERDKKERVNI